MPLFLCHVHLSVPTSTYHLLSDTASVERAAESSIDKGRVVLHQFSSSVKSIVICKSHCNSWCHCYIVPFEVPLTSVRLKYKWFVQPKLHQEISFWHPLPCHVLFQDCWGDYIVVYLDVFQYSTSKGLRRKMLFLCPLLVPLPCSFEGSKCFIHKTLAYLFLRVCWAIFTKYYFHSWRGFRRKTLYVFCHALVPLLCPLVSKCQ